MTHLHRRQFIQSTAVVPLAASVLAQANAEGAPEFRSQWQNSPDRPWLGMEYWANPLQDWRIHEGRAECINGAANRNVHLLTRQLSSGAGTMTASVVIGLTKGGAISKGNGSAGLRVAVQGPLKEYRNNLAFGNGLDAGFEADGRLVITGAKASEQKVDLNRDSVELRLTLEAGGQTGKLKLSLHDPATGQLLGEHTRSGIPAAMLAGNISLVSNFGGGGSPRKGGKGPAGKMDGFWFQDWKVSGSKVEAREEHAFGPILFAQYTLSGNTLKLTAQMPPVGPKDSPQVRLEVQQDGGWKQISVSDIHPQARTATFKVENWDSKQDVPYRVAYALKFKEGADQETYFSGTVRHDPVEKPELSVADISCNIHNAFPNSLYVENTAKLNPDFLAFTGDQFYESTGGYGVQRGPLEPAILDYLRKWYFHGWTWRDLMRDRPSISIPDDHDVYQGNIWGEAGSPQTTTQEAGGYNMPPEWVNVVHRTQTSHHPDPFDPTPVKQQISVYYGSLTYGGISFAILADRQFKTAPEGNVPPTGGRADHERNPNFDPTTVDKPNFHLLGTRQEKFLESWLHDWKGAEMKAVISQTIFTAMATTHGGTRDVLRADYDTNGWPQTARHRAVKLLRQCFAVHLAGDQHLPAVVQYGVDGHRDGSVAFAGPAVNVGYPRWWEPKQPGANRLPDAPEITGDFIDHFGNRMTVLAVANGAIKPQGTLLEQVNQRASGLGLVIFNKPQRTITIHCWPYLADPTQPDTEFPGWPLTIAQLQNHTFPTPSYLPTLELKNPTNPPVLTVHAPTGALLYTLRLPSAPFRPPVPSSGSYTLTLTNTSTQQHQTLKALPATPENTAKQTIDI